MARNRTYPLIGPHYPLLLPCNSVKPAAKWREWGRSPQPTPIRIGLPRAAVQSMCVPVCAAQTDVRSENTNQSPTQSTFYPRMINESRK